MQTAIALNNSERPTKKHIKYEPCELSVKLKWGKEEYLIHYGSFKKIDKNNLSFLFLLIFVYMFNLFE